MGWSSLMFLLSLLLHSQSLHSSSLSSFPSPPFPPPMCHPSESSALLLFKNSFSVQNGSTTVSWRNGTNCCEWAGVSCDSDSGHVTGLDLSSSFLRGPLHSNSSLFSLLHLQSLILQDVDFCGSPIPPEIGGFSNMTHLLLLGTNFTGKVPVELSHLSKLVVFFVSSIGTDIKLVELKLEQYVFKRMLQNLTNLRELILFELDMVDVEPIGSLMNISSSLEQLFILSCQLRGNFPENIFRLPNLRELNLDYNFDLVGSLPTFNWSSSLTELSLSGTKISIDLQYLMKSAKSLEKLFLSNCSFQGSYPQLTINLTQLSQLTLLDLSDNKFVGQLPEIDSTNSSAILVPLNLTFLSISGNFLTGSIPSWIFSLPSLVLLNLGNNHFTGCLEEFKSRSLQLLGLSNNNLNGQIPSSIFQQDDLSFLDLSSNNLSGILELQKLSKLKNLGCLVLSFNNFSLNLNSYANNSLFPQLQLLGLASCNIKVFPNFLTSLERLEHLDLSNNQLQNRVPQWLGNGEGSSLTYLNLSHNFLTRIEQIPWRSLEFLDLRSNILQGHLPLLPPSLVGFFVSNNQLTGEMPTLFCNLSVLEFLDLSNNSFHGKIPSCIGNHRPLSVLDLKMNMFNGIIPDMFTNTTQLRSLHLNGNQLEGRLPRSLRNCQILELLDVGNNKINDTFPHWLETIPMLQVLILRSNKFQGSIGDPKVKSPFRKLRIIDLSYNEFNGLLPTKYFSSFTAMAEGNTDGNLSYIGGTSYYQDSVAVTMKGFTFELERIITIFTTIDFSRNCFEGSIPKSIGKLKMLKGLNLSQNKLIGPIPTSLSNLTNLEWLDLSLNMLVGQIPWQLEGLTQLQFLNLSHNELVGPIPTGNQFNTFDSYSYNGNPGLYGCPLTKSCSNINEAQQYQGDDGDDGDDVDDDGMINRKAVMMGYGSGVVIGISIGYMVLFTRRVDSWFLKIFAREPRHISIAPLSGRRRN